MITKRYSFLLLVIALSLLGLVIGCAPSYTEGDLDIARQMAYSEGYEEGHSDGYATGYLIGKAEGSTESTGIIQPTSSDFVYITRTGTKYHRASCRYLSQSSIKVERAEAIGNFGPCSVCDP